MEMMKINTNPNKIKEILSRGVEKIIVAESIENKLKSGKILRIKHGVDPTTKDLHLGYAVVYQKLRELQEMGHKIVFLVGDFTARFGDPTAQIKSRKLRPKKEVEECAKSYIAQIGKILDLKKTEIRRNSEWYDKFSGQDLLNLESRFTVSRMLERDMFQERIKKGVEINYHEPVYPMLQAYDSVMLKSDLTIIGSDQLFNEIQGRELQKQFNQKPQDIIAMSLLIGTDGKRKMSQSLENYIGITEPPNEQYGKIMSIPDDIIIHYFKLSTRLPEIEIKEMGDKMKNGSLNPRDAKAKLAFEIVSIYHNGKKAREAEKEFNKIFKEKKLPSNIPTFKIKEKKLNILDLLVKIKLAPTRSEAKRLVIQGGVQIDRETVKDWQKLVEIKKDIVVRAGKRKFIKIG